MAGFQEINRLQQGSKRLLRELRLALEEAITAGRDPKGTATKFRARYEAFAKEVDAFIKLNPPGKEWGDLVKTHTKKELELRIEWAERVHERRRDITSGLAGKYNKEMGQALAKAPHAGVKAVDQEVEKAIRQMVDGLITEPKVDASARHEIAKELTNWLRQQGFYEDTFYAVQNFLQSIARHIQRKLAIVREIEFTREEVVKLNTISPQQAHEADARVGALARRSRELDQQIEQELSQRSLKIKGYLHFRPKLVLKPVKGFLERAELQTGIHLTLQDIRVDLGTKIQIIEPFTDKRGVGVNPYVNVNVGQDLDIGANYKNVYQDGKWQGSEYKVNLIWRFP